MHPARVIALDCHQATVCFSPSPCDFLHMRNMLFALSFPAILALTAGCSPAADKPISGGVIADNGVVSSGMPTEAENCGNRASDAIGGPFHLTAHTGSPTTEDSFKGEKSLVFFGFTHCPDVCPTTMFTLGKAMSLLPEGKKAPRTVFISVDPARDSPEALAQYIKSNGFPANIVGLTGTLDELQEAVGSFKTTFSRDEETDGATGYLVSHSSILYLMDENWKLQTYFTPNESAESIASCLAKLG